MDDLKRMMVSCFQPSFYGTSLLFAYLNISNGDFNFGLNFCVATARNGNVIHSDTLHAFHPGLDACLHVFFVVNCAISLKNVHSNCRRESRN